MTFVRPLLIALAALVLALTASSAQASVFAWGLPFPPTPESIGFDSSQIDAANNFNLAITAQGTVIAWGANGDGQLGDGSTASSTTPVPVSGLSGVVQTATGNSDAIALLSDGTVDSWGNNQAGVLGDGTRGGDRTTPQPIPGLTNVIAVAAGGNHAHALLSNGTVLSWGSGSNGELGNGSTRESLVPTPIHRLSEVRAISAGNLFADALLRDGTVKTWGYNHFGQLGDGSTTDSTVPVQVRELSGVEQVSAGGNLPTDGHNMALLENDSVETWGDNESGQLGNGTRLSSSVPRKVQGLANVKAVAAGGSHSMALTEEGSVLTWGNNNEGQLGTGSPRSSTVPVEVLSGCQLVSAGSMHSLAKCSSASSGF